MDLADSSRIVVFVAYGITAVQAVRAWQHTSFSLRRMAVALVGGIATIWMIFYGWIIPLFWGTHISADSTTELAGLMSRVAHVPTAVGLGLILYVINRAEADQLTQAENAATRIRKALDQDDC